MLIKRIMCCLIVLMSSFLLASAVLAFGEPVQVSGDVRKGYLGNEQMVYPEPNIHSKRKGYIKLGEEVDVLSISEKPVIFNKYWIKVRGAAGVEGWIRVSAKALKIVNDDGEIINFDDSNLFPVDGKNEVFFIKDDNKVAKYAALEDKEEVLFTAEDSIIEVLINTASKAAYVFTQKGVHYTDNVYEGIFKKLADIENISYSKAWLGEDQKIYIAKDLELITEDKKLMDQFKDLVIEYQMDYSEGYGIQTIIKVYRLNDSKKWELVETAPGVTIYEFPDSQWNATKTLDKISQKFQSINDRANENLANSQMDLGYYRGIVLEDKKSDVSKLSLVELIKTKQDDWDPDHALLNKNDCYLLVKTVRGDTQHYRQPVYLYDKESKEFKALEGIAYDELRIDIKGNMLLISHEWASKPIYVINMETGELSELKGNIRKAFWL